MLPSIIQKAFGPRRRERLASRARLILCGSALSFMGGLLSGTAPLRGRAGLDLTVSTFDYRTAGAFWGLDDWWLALRVHAIVGGTPAYRREYVRDDAPRDAPDFDAWVVRSVLSPSRPLLKEARYLLAEESELRDVSLYHSVLAAVADGNRTRGRIANFIGRKDDTLRHPITVLEDAGFLVREDDVFRRGRSTYRIAEPLVTFYHAILRPEWARLERPGRTGAVWATAQPRFHSAVLGPHFEVVCRTWAREFAHPDTFGGPTVVGAGVVNNVARRRTNELDVVVINPPGRILSLGEAKVGEVMGLGHLERLEAARAVLARRDDLDVSATVPACYSGAGFTEELHAAADAGRVVLVDLDRLYGGE